MRTSLLASVSICLTLLALPAAAQDIRLIGGVTKSGNDYVLDCTKIVLKSTAIDLSKITGINDIHGKNTGTFTDPVIDVSSVTPFSSSLSVRQPVKLGSNMTFDVNSALNGIVLIWASLLPSYLPLDQYTPVLTGTWCLDPTYLVFVTAVATTPPQLTFQFPIPDVKNLAGLPIYSQAAIWQSTGPLLFLNPACAILQKSGS